MARGTEFLSTALLFPLMHKQLWVCATPLMEMIDSLNTICFTLTSIFPRFTEDPFSYEKNCWVFKCMHKPSRESDINIISSAYKRIGGTNVPVNRNPIPFLHNIIHQCYLRGDILVSLLLKLELMDSKSPFACHALPTDWYSAMIAPLKFMRNSQIL